MSTKPNIQPPKPQPEPAHKPEPEPEPEPTQVADQPASDSPSAIGIHPIVESCRCPVCNTPLLHTDDDIWVHPPSTNTLFGGNGGEACRHLGVTFRVALPLTVSTLDLEVE